jgi:hypothetical protein
MTSRTIKLGLVCTLGLFLSFKLPLPVWQSSHVKLKADSTLQYFPDEQGNIIPDFSRVGYHQGDKPIPALPVVKTLSPVPGDAQKLIQDAINEVSKRKADKNGYRGAILLKKGTYKIPGTLKITSGGIVLRGEGDSLNGTRLVASGKGKRSLIVITNNASRKEIAGTRTKITDEYVPVGTFSLNVSSAGKFRPGDKVIVFRPGTKEWIHDIKMDQIVERKGTKQWQPEAYDLHFERSVTKVEGNKLFIDNPVVMAMETKYGGGEVYKYSFDGRISEVGFENLYIESEYAHDTDEDHGWTAIDFIKAENCWVRNITTRYFGYGAVNTEGGARNITVIDSKCFDAKSVITGSRRYSFSNSGQMNLFMNLESTDARHDYATGAQVLGPNVFYNCTAIRTHADIGPHHRWAVGTLYDNIVSDGAINVQDRGRMGSGHGWAGANQVLWNCKGKVAAVQSPWVSAKNYCIGFIGEKGKGAFPDRPDGVWEGHNQPGLHPQSLYLAQLKARKLTK